jgi:hypothetical protein
MNDPTPVSVVPTPRHLWVVGAIALVWNGFGAFDYTMTETRNAAYMSAFTPEQLAYFHGFPKWAVATWALSVWGGVLGSLALLLRRRWAVPVFAVSLVTMLVTFFHNFVLTDGIAVMGGAEGLVFAAVIVVVGVALLAYARSLARKGVLR